ncbi:MAG: tRNA (guanosine(46)-N7)-methyltransferase TrmB [Bacteroidales bacterium]|nr:tRNA (guanosine(46)-N7)-methyltransferase TrmB [Bacteroidales bacterium]
MGRKNKLKHFAENLSYDNMFQPSYEELLEGYDMQGKWDSDFFKNGNPITLEVGCGKGEYTVGLGEKYSERNFIGMDIKGARMWRGCTDSNEKGMTNVAFVRNHVQMVPKIFAEAEIDELWITFPDPQPKKENKRLTSPRFMDYYRNILKPGAIINFKTDSEPLFDYTLEMIAEEGHELLVSVKDLYNVEGYEVVKSIKTFYENKFSLQGYAINYMQFKLKKI